jgi:hypothetical protein
MYNKDFYYKDSTMCGIIAPRGVGKTLLLTALAHEELTDALNNGYENFRIYHNGFLKKGWWTKQFGGDYLVEFGLQDIIETVQSENSTMSNGLVLIDEIASVQDNRYGAMGYGNILFSHWVVMIRKIGLTIMWAGQNEEVDRRLKMQCDLVGYPVVARADKGRKAGVTFVYQSGTYSYEGNRRKFLFNDLNKFWNAYDTSRIIKSQQINKRDINMMEEGNLQEEIFNQIYEHLENKTNKKMNIMEIKKLTGVDWNIKKLDSYIRYFGNSVKGNKGMFTFNQLYD